VIDSSRDEILTYIWPNFLIPIIQIIHIVTPSQSDHPMSVVCVRLSDASSRIIVKRFTITQ
jgi:hypothetical protein